MTLIAGLKCHTGLVLAADTEEVISEPPLLRTRGEKLHVLTDGMSDWRVIVAGAGDVDYIGMTRDFIQEKIQDSPANDRDIVRAIRDSVHEVWRDYARYAQGPVDLKLLIGTWSNDRQSRFIVVSGAAVREGRTLEAFGIGDATFRSLADRFLNYGTLSFIAGDMEAIRTFAVYAIQQAKQTIPGVGGNTRMLTLDRSGGIKWEKSWKIAELQDFFTKVDGHIRVLISGLLTRDGGLDIMTALSSIADNVAVDVTRLRKRLREIDEDGMLT